MSISEERMGTNNTARGGEESYFNRRRHALNLFGWLFGVERSTIVHNGSVYMHRWILYFGFTLRVHCFMRGDKDVALHNHPWWFITFPLQSYTEEYWIPHVYSGLFGSVGHRSRRVVRAFRFHFRGVGFRHRVLDPLSTIPTWTIVLSGPRAQEWGFFPKPNVFIPWHQYIEEVYDAADQVRNKK
jgi:hypothetical protein